MPSLVIKDLPADLHRRLKAQAEANHRSMTKEAIALLEAAGHRARLHTVEGGRHNDTWLVGGEAYWDAWAQFLASLGAGSGSGA